MANSNNRESAWKTFYPEGNGNAKPGYVLHHKDPLLKYLDPARYNEWRPEDLIMITRSEHTHIHFIGRHISDKQKEMISSVHKGKYVSEETRIKISTANKGKSSPNKGKHFSEESKAKMSAAKKGKSPWNKGKQWSEETKAKLSAAHKGKHLSEETKAKISAALKLA